MKSGNILKAASIAAGAVLLSASPAFALIIPIPEPSALSIYGAAVAGIIIGARLLRRK